MDKRILQRLLTDQRNRLIAARPRMYSHRTVENCLNLNSERPQIVAGVRGCGKTTLCVEMLRTEGKKFAYVNFDDERLTRFPAAEVDQLLEALYMNKENAGFTHLLFDEFPLTTEWAQCCKQLQKHGLHVVATRSADADSVPSDYDFEVVDLSPLSFIEYCDFHHIDKADTTPAGNAAIRNAFDRYLAVGGFPGFQNGPQRRNTGLGRLIDDILRLDIERGGRLAKDRDFHQFALSTIDSSPTPASYSRLAEQFGLRSEHTIKKYITLLQKSAMMVGLHKIAFRERRRTIGEKSFAADTSFLTPISRGQQQLAERRLTTAVGLELIRVFRSGGYRIHYYSERLADCDFVICENFKMRYGVQVCYDATDESKMRRKIAGLVSLARTTGCSHLTILTDCEHRDIESHGYKIAVRPACHYLLGRE